MPTKTSGSSCNRPPTLWTVPPSISVFRFFHGLATISIYVLLGIVRKQLGLELNLYPMSQILSLTLFEKMPLLQAFSHINCQNELDLSCNQLDLFDL